MRNREETGSHSDKIYAQLKLEIDSLVLMPDTILKETVLAERFGVSRTPVRDALNKLSAEGFLINVGGRGTMVASVPYPEALQAYEVRNLIEPFIAAQAAKNQRMHFLIAPFIEKIRGMDAEHIGKNPQEREDNDREFHMLIADLAQNPLIGKIVNDMRSKIRRVFYNAIGDDYRSGQQEHIRILEAILSADEALAASAMREHLQNAQQRIMQSRF